MKNINNISSYLKDLSLSFNKDNTIPKLVAVLVAVILWCYVMIEQNPIIERNVDVVLRKQNLSSGLVALNVPNKVTVRVKGPRTKLSEDISETIVAAIDMENISEGQHTQAVNAYFGDGQVIGVSPKEVSFYIDTVGEKDVAVMLRTKSGLKKDKTVASVEIQPEVVTITGASHSLDKVNTVVANLDISKLEDSFDKECELVALSDDGRAIPSVHVIPDRVIVSGKIVNQLISIELPIVPDVIGNVPEGTVIKKYVMTPEKVVVTGPTSLMASIKSINTEQLDLSKLKSNGSITAKLALPEKIKSNINDVKIDIVIDKDEKKK